MVVFAVSQQLVTSMNQGTRYPPQRNLWDTLLVLVSPFQLSWACHSILRIQVYSDTAFILLEERYRSVTTAYLLKLSRFDRYLRIEACPTPNSLPMKAHAHDHPHGNAVGHTCNRSVF
jgi:hypothetical protein